jgi:hypothetical protein
VKIDSEKNDFIVEELDDQTLVIKEGMLQILKMRLDDVRSISLPHSIETHGHVEDGCSTCFECGSNAQWERWDM